MAKIEEQNEARRLAHAAHVEERSQHEHAADVAREAAQHAYAERIETRKRAEAEWEHAWPARVDAGATVPPLSKLKDPVTAATPSAYQYVHVRDLPPGAVSIGLSVDAKSDAHIALAPRGTEHGDEHYEIVLGAAGDTKSVIRARNRGPTLAEYDGSCLAGKDVWISWEGSILCVGRGQRVGADEIMRVPMSGILEPPMRHMLVCTTEGASGSWTVHPPRVIATPIAHSLVVETGLAAATVAWDPTTGVGDVPNDHFMMAHAKKIHQMADSKFKSVGTRAKMVERPSTVRPKDADYMMSFAYSLSDHKKADQKQASEVPHLRPKVPVDSYMTEFAREKHDLMTAVDSYPASRPYTDGETLMVSHAREMKERYEASRPAPKPDCDGDGTGEEQWQRTARHEFSEVLRRTPKWKKQGVTFESERYKIVYDDT